ncbi:Putative rRNA-processing protein UTP23 [[Torrubiella] hemipterigena]|uniref:U three protein 23 n=1 Tax=[Torrubiella] hemipterigena TaxID=1531966 RepID=A0A0A1T6L1_9HYPO|nr:Putative rRNA-processing protein UTP23 [[Torrubiella] hemipterigena]
MRGKRSKQYRKLMDQYAMTFGFREPYQVLVDAEMVQDACRFKMDLAAGLERTVHGKVKPMITQCEIRKLYGKKSEAGVYEAIELAKSFERRRCGHHPDEFPEPLSTKECMSTVVDPKQNGENKHRYVVASQGQDVRRMLRGVKAVPLIYIKRSVMIMEPMADESAQVRAREERAKFRAELKPQLGKRKRDGEGDDQEKGTDKPTAVESVPKKPKKTPGAKGPNPLSVKKAKKKVTENKENNKPKTEESVVEDATANEEPAEAAPKKAIKKRRGKRKAQRDGDKDATAETGPEPAAAAADGGDED